MSVFPFYGTQRRDLFAIERSAMDRSGLVIEVLDRRLPTTGWVLDVGAGDGHTAQRLSTTHRTLVALEPSRGMIRTDHGVAWVQGEAEHLPFGNDTFDAAYATWAYFFSRNWDPSSGLQELHRVVRPGGPLLIVENLGPDEFSALAPTEINADPAVWERHGFRCDAIDTHFEFETLDDARTLLGFFFGAAGSEAAALRLTFRVGLFSGTSAG